jgi:hypothetical protein
MDSLIYSRARAPFPLHAVLRPVSRIYRSAGCARRAGGRRSGGWCLRQSRSLHARPSSAHRWQYPDGALSLALSLSLSRFLLSLWLLLLSVGDSAGCSDGGRECLGGLDDDAGGGRGADG